jgi:putative sigma-54 modulation protein
VQFQVSARHGHLSATNQDLVKEKVDVIKRHFDRITSIQVTVDLQHKDEIEVELRVLVEHADEFIATARTSELSSTLDAVVDKIDSQVRKHKEKVRDHHKTSHKHIPTPTESEPE